MRLSPEKAEEIRAWFREKPNRMTIKASRHFEVPEASVLEALEPEWPLTELRPDAFRDIMVGLRNAGLIRVLVRNGIAVLESDIDLGKAKFSQSEVFYNMDGGSQDLHIMYNEIKRIYALEKASHMNVNNITYSFQFYGADGQMAMKAYLWQNWPHVPTECTDCYRAIVEETRLKKRAVSAA